jgi:phosphohistidine phosphatase
MQICFLRHGEADWPDWDKPDDERPLTRRGRKEMKRAGEFLARLKFRPDVILSSPLPRASQTAEIAAKHLGLDVQIAPDLAHGFNSERLRRIIAKSDAECIMVVGHEPEFSRVVKDGQSWHRAGRNQSRL